MNQLLIEWRHLDQDGNTCLRCSDTGAALDAVVTRLAAECRACGWDIHFAETRLGAHQIDQSNLILINGMPIEDILPGATAGKNTCDSCCELAGRPTDCRTVEFAGKTYDAIPESLIRAAVCKVAECC